MRYSRALARNLYLLTKPNNHVPNFLQFCAVVLFFIPLIGEAQPGSALPTALQQPAALIEASYSDFSIVIDTVASEIGVLSDADLTGYSTYRIYVTTSLPTDQVSAVYGNIEEPSQLLTTGDIFQSSPLGDITPGGIIPALWGTYPSNEYDSYVTIGLTGAANAGAGEGDINIIESTSNPWTTSFEPDGGMPGTGIIIDDITGGSWFTLPSFNNGIAGDDLRVLIAQVTTNGALSGNLHIQIFLDGDNLNGTVYLNLPIPFGGCTDPTACNFDTSATFDDASCIFPPPGLDCGGNCLEDLDGDGICDPHESNGCTYAAACNYDPEATEDDGSCTFPAPGQDCNGDCLTLAETPCAPSCIGPLGCTYPGATNFNATATCDDGTCTFDLGESGTCVFDQDGNGLIGSYDLIFFLTLIGQTCSE